MPRDRMLGSLGHQDDTADFDALARTRIWAGVPVIGGEVDLVERVGSVNNADLFLDVPLTWVNGITTTGANLVPFLRLYQLVQGVRHRLRDVTIARGHYVQTNANSARLRVVVARGLVCDGFLVSVVCPALPHDVTATEAFGRDAQGMLFSWGCETASAPIGEALSGEAGEPVEVVPSSGGEDFTGTIPAGPAVTASLTAGLSIPCRNAYVYAESTNKSPIYIGASAGEATASCGVLIAPGGSWVYPEGIDDASKIFIGGDFPTDAYRVRVVL